MPRISVRSGNQDREDYAPIIKWRDVDPGTEIDAVYKGMRQGKFGPLADLESEDGGKVTAPVPTALMTQLSRVRTGAKVSITYNGKRDGASGRTYHDFQVDVFDEADLLPEGTEPVIAPAKGGDRLVGQGGSPGGSPVRDKRPIGLAGLSKASAPAAETSPAPAQKAKGRTMKGVFAGLD